MKKRATIIRKKTDAPQTFGQLYVGNTKICDTLEPTALKVECGFYDVVPHGWEPNNNFIQKETWALVGTNVSHQPEAGIPRSAVLFHIGNWIKDSRACILPGTRAMVEGEIGVASSKDAMERLRKIFGNRSFYLTIKEED